MKKRFFILSLCVVAGCGLLSGCSKSDKTSAPPKSGEGADAGTAVATTDAPVEMRLKWTPGKKYVMRMEFNQGTETKLPNQPEPMRMDVKMTQDFNLSELKQLDGGGRELEIRFESMGMDVSQNGNSVLSYDSTKNAAPNPNDPVAPMLQAMIGTRIQYFCDEDGQVQKVGGVAELMKRIAKTAKPQQQAMFSQMFSEDTLKQYGSFGEMMPNRMVNVGESWPMKKDIVNAIGVLTVDLKYTFANWEQHSDRKCAHITVTGDISTKSTSNKSGAVVEIKKGKISGDVWFDPELGMIVDVNNEQAITMKVTTREQTLTPQTTQKVRMMLLDVR